MRVLGREGKGRERFDFRSTSLEEITIYREGERERSEFGKEWDLVGFFAVEKGVRDWF